MNDDKKNNTLRIVKSIISRSIRFIDYDLNYYTKLKKDKDIDIDVDLLRDLLDVASGSLEEQNEKIKEEIKKLKNKKSIPTTEDEKEYYVFFKNQDIHIYNSIEDLAKMNKDLKTQIHTIIYGISLPFSFSKCKKDGLLKFNMPKQIDFDNKTPIYLIYPRSYVKQYRADENRVSNQFWSFQLLEETCNHLRNNRNIEPIRILRGKEIHFKLSFDCKTNLILGG